MEPKNVRSHDRVSRLKLGTTAKEKYQFTASFCLSFSKKCKRTQRDVATPSDSEIEGEGDEKSSIHGDAEVVVDGEDRQVNRSGTKRLRRQIVEIV